MTNDDRFHRYRYFKDASEFRALDGYVDRVSATPADFVDALGWYSLKKKAWIECSLSGCRTLHGDGIVVRLQDGRITNVGHICGGKAFGDAFRTAVRAINAQKEMDAIRDGLERYRRELPALEERLEALRSGARGVRSFTKARNTLREMLPSGLARELARRALRNERVVYRAVRRTDSEVELAESQEPSLRGDALQFKEERMGHLVGLALFGRDPEEILDKHVDDPLRQFRNGFAAIGAVKLRRLHKAMEAVVPGLQEAEKVLEEGWYFFQDANFSLMEQMVSSDGERTKIRGARRLLLATNVKSAA